MNTSIVLSLDTRRPKVDGTCAIVLRITHHGKVSQINTGFFAKNADWNDQSRTLKNSFKGTQSVTRLNNLLQKKKSEAIDLLAKLDERKTLDTYSERNSSRLSNASQTALPSSSLPRRQRMNCARPSA